MLKKLQKTTGAALFSLAMLSFALGCAQTMFGMDDDAEIPGPITELYYTTDDGKTWFADKAELQPPFDKDGKEAVRVYIFTCDERKTTFVGYMERLTPEAKKKAEALQKKAETDPSAMADLDMLLQEGVEVKKPGGKWVKRNTEAGDKIIMVTCPDGTADKLEIVLPGD